VQRVAADQLLFAPIFNPIFIGSLAVLEGSTATLGERLRAQYVDIMVGNWVIWGPAQFVNFMFIPQQYVLLLLLLPLLLCYCYCYCCRCCCCCCCCAHVPPLLVVLLPLRLYYCTTNSLSSPLRYAVLFSNCIGMVWNVFLSYTANGGGKTVEDEKKKE